jgi:enoyl-CoA hydratase
MKNENETVLFKKEERIGFITINRPEVKNALNIGVFRALDRILENIRNDDDVRAVIITGADSAFVAGADINDLISFDSIEGWSSSRFQQSVFNKIERLGKPSIAAINGVALGGGLELALSCTMRVGSVKARMGFPELDLGIIPAFGGTERLVRTVGFARATELILLRSIIDGNEAYKIGLVNQVVAQDQVEVRAKELAQDLAALSPVAVRLELELLLESKGELAEGLALESALAALAVSTKEAKTLLRHFVSKGKGG